MRRSLAVAAALLLAPLAAIADTLPSGTAFLGRDLKTQQADEAANPGMLWVATGRTLWRTPAGSAQKSCASCHGDAASGMRGVATRYPQVDPASGRLINLEGRINQCRTAKLKAPALALESEELLALSAFVARQSKGLPIAVNAAGAAKPFYDRGKAFFHTRRGQLNLSCANCHVDNAGRKLRAETISHAVPSGYPIYRLEWQSLGSLHRRFRACALGVRSTQYPLGAQVYLELELYLAHRANGVAMETPAMRR